MSEAEEKRYIEASRFIGTTCLPLFKKQLDCLQKDKLYSNCKPMVENFHYCLSTNFKEIFPGANLDDSYLEQYKGYDKALKEGRVEQSYQDCFKHFNMVTYCEQFELFGDQKMQKPCLKRILKSELCQMKSNSIDRLHIEKFQNCFNQQFPKDHEFLSYPELDKKFRACQ